MATVNSRIRQQVRQLMKERGMTQEQLAALTGIAAPNISRLLRDGEEGIGSVPKSWQKVLDVLRADVELTVRPASAGAKEEAQ